MTMQGDMKIGLALGIGVVGLVAALFFRREAPTAKTAPPPLAGAEEIDREIADKPRAPYIQGVEEPTAAPAAPPRASQAGPFEPPTGKSAYELPGFLTSEDEAEHRVVLSNRQPAPPDPIAPADTAERQPGPRPSRVEPPPAHNREWDPTGPERTPARRDDRAAASGPHRTHVIRAGDTLSGLAARYLGSSARFQEIYEANRTVLKSPHDLPDGVTIVIPDGATLRRERDIVPSTPASRTRRPPASDPEESIEGEPAAPSASGSPKIRFVPVNRGPFSAGRAKPADRPAVERQPPPDLLEDEEEN